MTDSQLKARAGLNVGNQPGFLTFIQKAGVQDTVIPTSGAKVVVLEGIEDGHRTLNTLVEEGNILANGTAQDYDYELFFEDDAGNQISVGTGIVSAAVPPGVGTTNVEVAELSESMFALAPGEKFLLSVSPREGGG